MVRLARHGGFTLLEVLVVLVIVGLTTGLLLQGLQHTLRLQERFSLEMFNGRTGAMQSSWYREVVNGLMPDHGSGKNRFKGERQRFEGLTLAPLVGEPGSPVPFAFELRVDARSKVTSLNYVGGEDPFASSDNSVAIMSWTGGEAEFVYFDEQGEPHDAWPPFLGSWPQLPSSIRLRTGSDDRGVIVAAPKGPPLRLPRLADVENL